LHDPSRLAVSGDADLMFQFWLKGRGDGMKHCRIMKGGQQAHLGSMGWKRDTMRLCDDVS
jgi:hypothetical protein